MMRNKTTIKPLRKEGGVDIKTLTQMPENELIEPGEIDLNKYVNELLRFEAEVIQSAEDYIQNLLNDLPSPVEPKIPK